eukprot:5195-Eustigmatos_ZCMA.PRE.1
MVFMKKCARVQPPVDPLAVIGRALDKVEDNCIDLRSKQDAMTGQVYTLRTDLTSLEGRMSDHDTLLVELQALTARVEALQI